MDARGAAGDPGRGGGSGDSGGAGDLLPLVRAAQRGDAGAFACLIERAEPGLRRFCVRLAGEAGADDLAQETLLRACRAIGSLEQPQRFEPWLFAIAANLARRWWRQQLRWPVS